MTEPVLLDETDSVWVFDKPAGVAVNPSDTSPHRSLLERLGPRARLVHRLDRDTTGVWVVAKTAEGARVWSQAFRDRRVEKLYWALCLRLPDREVVDAPIGDDPRRPRARRIRDDGKPARTALRPVQSAAGLHWIEARPETGRTHQIRIHLERAGAPIWGDTLYGGVVAARAGDQVRRATRVLLHARSLELEGRTWTAPVPADFRALAPEMDWPAAG